MATSLLNALIPVTPGILLNQSLIGGKSMSIPATAKGASQNKYEVVGKLGVGGFAVVISVRDKDGKCYALKKPFHESKYIQASTGVINMKELYIMAHVKHPYIQAADTVFFEDPCPDDKHFLKMSQGYDRMFFLMDMAKYTCHELTYSYRSPISHVKRAMFQATCALLHLHSRNISHRDIKPGNLLCYYTKGVLTVKLTDFGMTKPFNHIGHNSVHAGTSYYRAPEIILGNQDYGLSADVWSLGCTFFELVCRRAAFKGDSDVAILNQIFAARGSPDVQTYQNLTNGNGVQVPVGKHRGQTIRTLMACNLIEIADFNKSVVDNLYNPGTFDDFCDLLEGMICLDPYKRLTIEQVLQHKFFAPFFQSHIMDHGLWRPDLHTASREAVDRGGMSTIQIFPAKHPYWRVGAMVIAGVQTEIGEDTRYDEELAFAIRFHTLDVYSRFLLEMEPSKDKVLYEKIAWCSGYIISKFYLDESSYHLYDLFPEAVNVIGLDEISKIEKIILQGIKFEIYRPTCLSYLKYRSFYAALFALMLNEKGIMFGRPIGKIMDLYNREIERLIKASPEIVQEVKL